MMRKISEARKSKLKRILGMSGNNCDWHAAEFVAQAIAQVDGRPPIKNPTPKTLWEKLK